MISALGCTAPRAEGAPHPELSVEIGVQLLADLDYLATNYAWLLALFGF